MRIVVLAASLCLVATASQAADGCGPRFHADVRGICRPNAVVIERPVVVARPVVVERPVIVERPVVVERPIVRRPVVEEVVVRRPVVPTCGVRVGPIAVRGVC